MRAAVLAVGSELLSIDRLDTNSLRLAAALEPYGVILVRKSVVQDDEAAIASEIVRALEDADLVLVGGGLGPTADDVTREACARALSRSLVEDAAALAAMESRFVALGQIPSANNRRQALRIEGASLLANSRGSAPGQRLDLGSRTIFLLPGVPYELDGLIESELGPWLERHTSGGGLERRMLRVALRPESEIDQRLEAVYARFGREAVTVLASPGEVRVVLIASGEAEARRERLDEMAAHCRELLGEALFGEGEGATLERVVGDLLAERGLRLATAESCTGGLVAQRLTAVPGSSRYFPGGIVTYENDQKERWLGVSAASLAEQGAVSEPVAKEMARGVRERFGADLGVAVTGIAGPEGGSQAKPVGTVHLAVDGLGAPTGHRRLRLPGDRERIRWQASQAALELVRRRLLGLDREVAS